MHHYYFLLLLLTIIGCIEGGATYHDKSLEDPTFVHSIDNGGTTSRHLKGVETVTNTAADNKEEEERMPTKNSILAGADRLIKTNSFKIAKSSKKVDEKEPGEFRKFLGRVRAVDITRDKKGMMIAYSVLFLALIGILIMGYSIQRHNQDTYVHQYSSDEYILK